MSQPKKWLTRAVARFQEISKPVPAEADTEPPDAWDKGAAWLAKHGALPVLGLLTIAMMVLFSDTFAGETVGDDNTFHMAESRRIADCLMQGDWDFWNPSANGGYASLYYYQALPQLASAIPTALFGHHLFWFQVTIVLPHVLAPAAAYKGMRLMGASPWESLGAALVVAFMNGESRWGAGPAGTYHVGLYTQSWALAALPLALGYAVRFVMDRKSLAAAIFWGTFCCLCHPFIGVGLAVIVLVAFIALGWLAMIDEIRGKPQRRPIIGEFIRSAILGLALLIAWTPIWVPLVVDYEGFGGFPHRVSDEVGPGFKLLADWIVNGKLLDYGHYAPMLTFAIPVVLVFARGRYMRWLWPSAIVFALLLGIGPHIGKTGGDDLVPAVRFLGTMQVLMALGIGAGVVAIGRRLWNARLGSHEYWTARGALELAAIAVHVAILYQLALGADDNAALQIAQRLSFYAFDIDTARWLAFAIVLALGIVHPSVWRALATQYGVRTGIAAIAAAALVMLVQPGWQAHKSRLWVLPDYPADKPGQQRKEIFEVMAILEKQPPARKQVGPGCENHWWNLLHYVYARIPSLLQMGGGGLQASPNYDFVWSVRDFKKLAWVYATPYLVFASAKEKDVPAGETIAKTELHEVRRLPAGTIIAPVHIKGMLPDGPTRAGSEARKKAIEWLHGEDAYADRVLGYPGYAKIGPEPDAIVLRSFAQDSPGDEADIIGEVDVSKPTHFIARTSWHPRWHAYIDGKETRVGRVTPDFPVIEVPPGKHVVAFRFERPWWAHAVWLLWPLATLLAFFGLRIYNRSIGTAKSLHE